MGTAQTQNQLLLTIRVVGVRSSTSIPTQLPHRPSFVSSFLDCNPDNIQRGFVVETSASNHLNREKFQTRDYYR